MNETIKATLTADGSKFASELSTAQQRTEKFQQSVMVAGKAIAGFMTARALIRGLNNLRQEIDELGKTATRLQMPTAEVQVLDVAAKVAGTNVEALAKSLNRAQVAATEAGRGTETYAREFAALNIDVANFQRLDPQSRLKALADAYQTAGDRGEAFTALTRIMGRSVSNLIPLLEKGSAGVEEMAASVRTLDEGTVRRIEELNDKITLLTNNIKTSLMSAIVGLEGPINRVLTGFAEDLEATLNLLDPARGIGKGGDLFAALEALREINAMGGEGADRDNEKYRVLVARFGEMNEQLQEQARLMIENEKVARLLRDGLLSAAEAEAIFEGIRYELERMAEEAEYAKHVEEERAAAARETQAAMEAQAKAAEQLAKDEVKLQDSLTKKIFDLKSAAEKLAALRGEGSAILKRNDGAEVEEMQRRIAKTSDPEERVRLMRDLERMLELREEILKLEQEIAREQKSAADKAASAAEKALRAKEKELEAAKQAAELEAERTRGKAAFAAETEALKLELAGRKDLAEALREEMRMREQGLRLAEQMGITEEQALELIREQAALRRQIQRDDTRGGRGDRPGRERGLRTGRLETGRLGESRRLDGSPTLREATLDRRSRERGMLPRNEQGEKEAQFWAQQIGLQERLVQIFEKLGAV